MKKSFLYFLIISLVVAIIMYISSNNIILSLGVLIVFICVSILFINPKIVNFYQVIDRYHECFHFINTYIISLSIKQSVSAALETTSLTMGESFNFIFEKLEDLSEESKIKYLESYFPFYSYQLFVQIVGLWQEEGGDILKMSNYLLNEIRQEEEYVTQISSLAKRKYIESVSLWSVCLLILVLLKFSLSNFYLKIQSQKLFLLSLALLSGFILFSIYVLVLRGTKIQLKGYKQNEKLL